MIDDAILDQNKVQDSLLSSILKKFDIQLLIGIIGIFISAWFYLCICICEFTHATPLGIQFSYMFAHYIITLFILMCLYLCYVKGSYMIKETERLKIHEKVWFELMMKSWPWLLMTLFFLICISLFFPMIYIIAYIVMPFVLFWGMRKIGFNKTQQFVIPLMSFSLFPIFISTMSLLICDIQISFTKDYYELSDNLIINVNTRSYSSRYDLIGIDENDLIDTEGYEIQNGLLIIPVSNLKSNELSVAVQPLFYNFVTFLKYPFYKWRGLENEILINKKITTFTKYKNALVNIKI